MQGIGGKEKADMKRQRLRLDAVIYGAACGVDRDMVAVVAHQYRFTLPEGYNRFPAFAGSAISVRI